MIKIGRFFQTQILLGIFFFAALALAKPQIQVQATVDRNAIALGETITVVVSVKADESVDVQDPKLNDLDGFDIINQWNSNSVRSSFVNGHMAHEVVKSINYTMTPQRQGSLTIGAFEVNVEGQIYRTQPITVRVQGQASPQNPSGRQQKQYQRVLPPNFDDEDGDPLQRLEEEMFNQLLQRRGLNPNNPGAPGAGSIPGGRSRPKVEPQLRTLPTNPDEAFFIQVEVDKLEVFENEQITVSWYLYTRGQMESLDRVKFPDLKGFWKEIIEEIPQLQFTEEIINGVVYRKALLASHALFPIKAGTSYIDEYKIKSRVRLPVAGFGFGVGRSYEYQKTSKKVSIKVNPLPNEGRPKSFTGAVGQFEVHAKIENQQFPVNQPFSLKIRFEGEGNAKLIELPAIQWPDGIEVYDTKTDSKFFKTGTSYKEFEVLLIPRKTGPVEIPSFEFSQFNPKTKKYEIKKTEVITLKIVDDPKGSPNSVSQRITDPTSKPLALTPVKKEPSLILNPNNSETVILAQSPLLWAGLFGTVLALLMMKAQREFGWGLRQKSIKEKLQIKFKKIHQLKEKNLFREVGSEVCNSYYFVLGQLSDQGGGSQEIHKLLDHVPASVRRDFGADILKNFEIFQTLAFAPEEMLGTLKTPESMKTHLKDSERILYKLSETQGHLQESVR